VSGCDARHSVLVPRRLLALGVSLLLAAPVVLLAAPARAAAYVKPYDFNGDLYRELVVGAPRLTVATHPRAGGVFVLPASKTGVAATAQAITAAFPGVVGSPHDGEGFGAGFTSGDFDGDGFADLAVSRPGAPGGGAVTVVYGSARGLTGARSLELRGPRGGALGSALVAGDLDGDGRADLAVGTPFQTHEPGMGIGEVAVFRGSTTGLSQVRSSLLHGLMGAPDAESGYDLYFGSTLAVGDVDQDGRTDLVVGSSGAIVGSGEGFAGSVDVCYGAPGGPAGCTQLDQSSFFSGHTSLAVGNVSGSVRPEIVVGIPDTEDDGYGEAVQILSLSGARASTTVTAADVRQGSRGVPGASESGDDFGRDVVLGDLDGDGYADLVVGAPGEDDGRGRVTVVYGGATGYRTTGARVYDQTSESAPVQAAPGDRFGSSVAPLFDHDRDGHPDLAVGAPGEGAGSGAITLLRGSGTSFTTKGSRTFGLGTLGYPTRADAAFGGVLGR
jgi:hypothetical protein